MFYRIKESSVGVGFFVASHLTIRLCNVETLCYCCVQESNWMTRLPMSLFLVPGWLKHSFCCRRNSQVFHLWSQDSECATAFLQTFRKHFLSTKFVTCSSRELLNEKSGSRMTVGLPMYASKQVFARKHLNWSTTTLAVNLTCVHTEWIDIPEDYLYSHHLDRLSSTPQILYRSLTDDSFLLDTALRIVMVYLGITHHDKQNDVPALTCLDGYMTVSALSCFVFG